MTSKQSIMLSTDGPDGDASTGKFITPSAHILAASASKGASSGTATQHSSSDASAGDRIITPSSAKLAAPASSSVSLGFGDADGSASSLLPSSLDSVSSRLPFNPSAPRALAPSITSEMAASMSTLSAAFASMMAASDKGEQESKQLEGAINALQGSAAGANAAAAGAEPSKLSTCFDLITSTATRIPLSTIIAASSSHPSKAAAAAGSAPALPFALDSYVVVEPIDWSRHHHDSTFARLTAVNRSADQVDEIAMELAREREQLQKQVEDQGLIIGRQRRQIEELQRQLKEALGGGAATAAAAPASSAAGSSSSSSSSSSAAASVAPKRFPNDTSDDESDDDDIDQGMADEEDFRGSRKPAAKASSSSSTAGTATFSG